MPYSAASSHLRPSGASKHRHCFTGKNLDSAKGLVPSAWAASPRRRNPGGATSWSRRRQAGTVDITTHKGGPA